MWKEVDTVVYYLHEDFKFHQTIAIFNLFDTLVKPWYKKKEQDISDSTFKYCNKFVKTKLTEISERGASIIIYQSFYTPYLDDIKILIEKFIEHINLPISVFFSTKLNMYAKPFTHMWKLINLFYKNKDKVINKDVSIFVGNNAGRIDISSKQYNKKIINLDKSCVDRAFANNIGITFYTPELFFNASTNLVLWKYNENIISKKEKNLLVSNPHAQTPIILEELKMLPQSEQYIIIVSGSPVCGKTTLAQKIKRKWDIDYKMGKVINISENDYLGQQDYIDVIILLIEEEFRNNNSIILDITNNFNNVLKIIKSAMSYHIPILFLEIIMDKKVSLLLEFIRIQKGDDANNILRSKFIWDAFYNQYIEQQYSDIKCIHHVKFNMPIFITNDYWLDYTY
jgi:DNA 3'-phosphatase